MMPFSFRAVLLGAAMIGCMAACSSDRFLFIWPADLERSALRNLSRNLERSADVAFLLRTDRNGIFEWVSSTKPICMGVELEHGPFDYAIQFNGTRWCAVQTSAPWGRVNPSHTVSMWVKLQPPSDQMDIMFSSHGGRSVGLKLERGNIVYYPPGRRATAPVAYPFDRWGEYVHLAAVIDAERGTARLYENGELKSSADISVDRFPRTNIEFGTRRWYFNYDPFAGSLGEVVIWNRCLSDAELQAIAQKASSQLPNLSRLAFWGWQLARGWSNGLRQLARYVDHLNPFVFYGAALEADIPEVHLEISRGRLRKLNREHVHSRTLGRRTDAAAQFKKIGLAVGDEAIHALLALDGSDSRYGASVRPGYLIEADTPWLAGLASVRLTPPENIGWLTPLFDAHLARRLGLPHVRNGICRLFVNGRFQGVYYYEDDSRRGISSAAVNDHFMRAPLNTGSWPFLFESVSNVSQHNRGAPRDGIPLSINELLALYNDLADLVFPLWGRDLTAPHGRLELAYERRRQQDEIGNKWQSSPLGSSDRAWLEYLTASLLAGENPSPHYIRGNLQIPPLLNAWHWSSSNPDVISPDGTVSPPAGDLPVEVVLTAAADSGRGHVNRREFTFRVMPDNPRIQALFIYVNEPLQKHRRVCARIERGGPDALTGERYRAFQDQRAGIKFRGNTSFWQTSQIRNMPDPGFRKTSFSLKLESPHGWLDGSNTRHIYLGNNYLDIGFLRNKLSYDLFRAMSAPGNPRVAAHIDWAEVFLNGRYLGLYEMGTRIDRHLIAFGYSKDSSSLEHLYKFRAAGDNFGTPRPNAQMQKWPPRHEGQFLEPYLDLVDTVRSESAAGFVANIEKKVDVIAVADWQILLNLTENRDGVNVNLYLAKMAGQTEKFFLIPWDYDKTFAHGPHRWFSNSLTSRLWREYPQYRESLRERWRFLRGSAFSDEAVQELIRQTQLKLEGYAQWDYMIWDERYSRGRSFEGAVESTRSRVLERLAYLDQHLEIVGELIEEPLDEDDVEEDE